MLLSDTRGCSGQAECLLQPWVKHSIQDQAAWVQTLFSDFNLDSLGKAITLLVDMILVHRLHVMKHSVQSLVHGKNFINVNYCFSPVVSWWRPGVLEWSWPCMYWGQGWPQNSMSKLSSSSVPLICFPICNQFSHFTGEETELWKESNLLDQITQLILTVLTLRPRSPSDLFTDLH